MHWKGREGEDIDLVKVLSQCFFYGLRKTMKTNQDSQHPNSDSKPDSP